MRYCFLRITTAKRHVLVMVTYFVAHIGNGTLQKVQKLFPFLRSKVLNKPFCPKDCEGLK